MGRPKIEGSEKLTMYTAKIDKRVKATIAAITQIKGKGYGHKELLNEALEAWGRENPEVMEKAQQLVDLVGDFE